MSEPPETHLVPAEPAGWPRPKGYSNGLRVPAGRDLVFVAGQIAWDTSERIVSDDFGEQFRQALSNCVRVVEAAGGQASDIVRLTIFCVDKQAYIDGLPAVGAAYRELMGRHYPCMSLFQVAELLEPGALVEIEATAAVVPASGGETGDA
jgi:enamine deaminase RidA (YjgF/YER057c/UK114 family)